VRTRGGGVVGAVGVGDAVAEHGHIAVCPEMEVVGLRARPSHIHIVKPIETSNTVLASIPV